jgi:hypothetical protein
VQTQESSCQFVSQNSWSLCPAQAQVRLHYYETTVSIAFTTTSANIITPIDPASLTSSVKKLSLQTSPTKSAPRTQKSSTTSAAPIADSWEDDSSSSSTETETEAPNSNPTSNPTSRPSTSSSAAAAEAYPSAPPPTPSSPSFTHPAQNFAAFPAASSISPPSSRLHSRDSSLTSGRPDRRPETTTATASRMIAAGLGVKAPKRTEEQREYDKAVREKERKRIEGEKKEAERRREEVSRARAAVWED